MVRHQFLISVDLEVDIRTNQCFGIFVMIGETLRMLLSDSRIRANDDFISKVTILDKALLISPTTGQSRTNVRGALTRYLVRILCEIKCLDRLLAAHPI